MILSLQEQARLFLLTILLGGGMGLVYDGLRVFRHAMPHKRFWIQAEDGLFWLLTVFLVFSVMLHASGGEIRFFSVFGLFGGMGLYYLTLSRWVIAVSDRIIALVRYIIGLFFRILCTPFYLLYLLFRRPLGNLGGFCVEKKKKLLHLLRMYVKIVKNRFQRDWKILRHGK